MAVKRTRHEVASIIERFLDGTGDRYEWDDFESVRIESAELDAIRARCADVYLDYPAPESGSYCSDAGREVLRAIANELRQPRSASDRERERGHVVATLASSFLNGELGRREFWSRVEAADYDNPLLDELLDRLEHQPKQGWFLGVSKPEYESYIVEMRKLIERAVSEARHGPA